MKTIATNIRTRLGKLNMTRTELSTKSNIGVDRISLLCNEKLDNLNINTLKSIATALNCEAWQLMKEDK